MLYLQKLIIIIPANRNTQPLCESNSDSAKMKTIEKILLIIILEIIIFWILVRYYYLPKLYSNPDLITAQNLIIITVIINVIIFGILYFTKKTKFKNAFLANIILAPIILLLVLSKAHKTFRQENFSSGSFQYNGSKFSVFVDKKKNNFTIFKTDINTNETNIIAGDIELQNDKILLKSRNEEYLIENDTIKGIEGKNFKLK